MPRTHQLVNVRTRRYAACTLCVIVLVSQVAIFVRAAEIDPRLTISVRTYTTLERMEVDLQTARAYVDEAFRQTGIEIEWLHCANPHPPSHCQSPAAADEVIVRIAAAKKTGKGPFVALGDSLVDRHTGSGCYATVYVDRVIALARKVKIEAGPVLGRAIAHEIGHLLLGASHADAGLMRKIWLPAELQRNDGDDWNFRKQEAAALRAAIAIRLARSAVASR